ncbi:hypothetical protein BOTBODRAFT_36291 [Botryobasidium botryosum FD-172 SS1]|uniref:RNase III domain-containing protein n=1 Tax=Botryobasidium botryosum (strain FD-172 SS1) TaxID=930990 RepID=A0A067MFQ4_BOTB1|nr:hypothetical protein BOTBODRAFT_36291 [Botryobasidium botryosum FD-172 SS1]
MLSYTRPLSHLSSVLRVSEAKLKSRIIGDAEKHAASLNLGRRVSHQKRYLNSAVPPSRSSSRTFTTSASAAFNARPRTFNDTPNPYAEPVDPSSISKPGIEYLKTLFPPLEFPEDVALRMLIHSSYRSLAESVGHNARLGFVGRRALQAHLMMFMTANAPLELEPATSPIDFEEVSERVLNTYALGEFVGGAWGLERAMRWVPAKQPASPGSVPLSSGLYKVRGATVEAVMGGLFHQFGLSASHVAFHTRVLPHLAHLLPRSMQQAARETSERMGGPNGLVGRSRPSQAQVQGQVHPDTPARAPMAASG